MPAVSLLKKMTHVTLLLALIVIVLGAYTRLSHAGLGCPDWPGCYGSMVVPAAEQHITEANELYPERPLEHAKAWKEMVHRYAAGGLGLLILAMSIIAWRNPLADGRRLWMPFVLLGLVVFQALLGMWTVTLLLKPIIVMGHLLGGMTILLLLVWQMLRLKYTALPTAGMRATIYPYAIIGLAVVYMQISLGGWTSANYAALVCPDLPTCQGQWWPEMHFREGFIPWRGLGVDYEFGVLDPPARTAVHVSHRIGAILTLIIIGLIAIAAIRDNSRLIKRTGMVLLAVLLTQFSLGVANIVFSLPIAVAVMHNGVASLLLACTGTLLFHARYHGQKAINA